MDWVAINYERKKICMAFMAHVAFRLNAQFAGYDWDKWVIAKKDNDVELRRRLKEGKTLEYVAGMFADKWMALRYGKQLYVSMFLQLLRKGIRVDDAGCDSYYNRMSLEMDGDKEDELPECLFIWNKNNRGGGIGLDIYEAESLDQIDDRIINFTISMQAITDKLSLQFDERPESPFDYNEDTHAYLKTLYQANICSDEGIKATLYTGILEKIVGEIEERKKVKFLRDQNEIDAMEQLSIQLSQMDISDESKKHLQQYLDRYRYMSAGNKVKLLCRTYGKKSYGEYSTDAIVSRAYAIRSAFAHVGQNLEDYSAKAQLIKWVVIDVVCKYLQEKNNENIDIC